MNTINSQRYLLHKQVFDLSVCCPFDRSNPDNCPLHTVRKMGVMERFEWLHGLSGPRLLDILAYHQRCLMRKKAMQKRKILVIDDEATFTKMLKMTLELNGNYEVCAVNDPRLAVDTAREFLPDVVILDIVMPELDGGEVNRLFKADSVLKHVPIIFLTVIVSQKEVDKHKGLIGGSFYVAKPVSAKTLMDIIEEQLHSLNGAAIPPARPQCSLLS